MTIEELYKLAVKNNIENTEIRITHTCCNCDHHFDYILEDYQLWFDEDKKEAIILV